jgi:hypothetical protein
MKFTPYRSIFATDHQVGPTIPAQWIKLETSPFIHDPTPARPSCIWPEFVSVLFNLDGRARITVGDCSGSSFSEESNAYQATDGTDDRVEDQIEQEKKHIRSLFNSREVKGFANLIQYGNDPSGGFGRGLVSMEENRQKERGERSHNSREKAKDGPIARKDRLTRIFKPTIDPDSYNASNPDPPARDAFAQVENGKFR